jgi:hypothetical protein
VRSNLGREDGALLKGCRSRGEMEGGGGLSSTPRGERKWGRASAGNHSGRRLTPARVRRTWATRQFKIGDGEPLTSGAPAIISVLFKPIQRF